MANGDVVHTKTSSGRERTGTIDSFSDGDGQFTVSYAITPLFDADIEADFNIEALKIALDVSNSTSNLGDYVVVAGRQRPRGTRRCDQPGRTRGPGFQNPGAGE